MNVGDKITYEANDYPKSVPKGTIGTVTNVRLSCVEFTVDGGDGYEWCARHGEYAPYKPTTGTLAELDVKAGDVVEFIKGADGMYKDLVGTKHTVEGNGGTEILPNGRGGFLPNNQHVWRIIYRDTDTPTLWRDMTPEEKGALLLAKHEGRRIECVGCGRDFWLTCEPQWKNDWAYRIAPPKPVVVKVEMYTSKKMKGFGLVRGPNSTHRITFNTVDGVPDCGSVKMVPVT